MKNKLNYYFYKTTNLINGKFYYGSGQFDNYVGSGIALNDAIKKYGKENFLVEKLKYFNTRKEAFYFEERFLKLYKLSQNKMCYNIVDNGCGGDTISKNPNKKNIILKIKNSRKKYLEENPPIREKNNFFGKTHTDELKSKWSINRKGEKNPSFGKTVKDRMKTEENYDNWKKSCSRKGSSNGRYGKSLMSIWVEKYGIEEAEIREKNRIEKRKINALNKLNNEKKD